MARFPSTFAGHLAVLCLSTIASTFAAGCGSSGNGTESTSDGGGTLDDVGGGGPGVCPSGALNLTNDGILGSTTSLRSDGTNVYYATIPGAGKSYDDLHFVMKLPVSGGTPVKLATGNHGNALSSFGLDDTSVYAFLDRALIGVPKAGGAPTKIFAPAGLAAITMTFAVDDASIWTADGAAGLGKMKKDGTGKTMFWSDPSLHVDGLTTDGEHVYFIASPPSSFGADAGPPAPDQLESIAKTGGTPTSLATISSDRNLEESIWQVVVDGDQVLYSTTTAILKDGVKTQFAIYSVAKTGGAVKTVVALGDTSSPAFAAGGGNVYFGGPLGNVKKVPETGGSPTELATTSDSLGAVTLDATNVYYEVRGCIFKAPR